MGSPNTLYTVTAAAVLLSLILGLSFLAQTGLPSADVVAKQAASRSIIKISDFKLGEVEIVLLNNRRVIVWRRNEADKALAATHNAPEDWRYQNSNVLGQIEPVFADDTNLTLNNEWFFALAEFSNKFLYLLPRAGEFEGLLEGRNVAHFDLAGRVRKGGGTNLTVIKAEYVDDGQSVQLFLEGKP